MHTTRWYDTGIRFGFYLLFGLVPFLLTPWNYELFEYNKMMAVYGITALLIGLVLTKAITEKRLTLRRTPFDWPIAGFIVSQLVSTLFSLDPHVSWFGYYSRFNGGVVSVLTYSVLFYLLTATQEAASIFRMLRISLVSATLIALYGVMEHFGIDRHIWVQDVQSRVFSTLGQPNWLASYIIALLPLSLLFSLRKKQEEPHIHGRILSHTDTIIWSVISVLFFLVLLYTRSRSGLLAFAVSDVIFWFLLTRIQRTKTITPIAVTIHLLFAVIIFFQGTNIPALDRYFSFSGIRGQLIKEKTVQAPAPSGPALETGGTESGTIRTYVWDAALRAFRSSYKTMAIGTGTETFAFAFYQFKPVLHNTTSEWDFLYNKAHNEFLNYLATTGLFGLGSYLWFIGGVIVWSLRNILTLKRSADPTDIRRREYAVALFSGWMSLHVMNFFGFSVVVTQLLFFLFPAALSILLCGTKKETSVPISAPEWTRMLPISGALFITLWIGVLWYADSQFALGYQQNRAGSPQTGVSHIMTAIQLNPAEPLYHDELASAYATLSTEAFSQQNATSTAYFANAAVRESDQALNTSPNNVNFLKTRTKVFYTLSAFDEQFNEKAIETLLLAQKLSPSDPKISYNLAILYGRAGQNEKAISYLLQAKTLKSDYRDAYNALNIFYTEVGQKTKAHDILIEYLSRINPADKDFQERVQ